MSYECVCVYCTSLSLSSAGGVELYVQRGKIKVENTLEARLAMLSYQVNTAHSYLKSKFMYQFVSF